MDTDDIIKRIRFEEKIRLEIKNELAKNGSYKRRNSLWMFLNSNFGLFIMSSIVLGFISWGYNEIQVRNTLRIKNEQNAEKLITEIRYRATLLEYKFQDLKTSLSSNRWECVYDIEDIFKGSTESITKGKLSKTEFSPIFSDFENRSITSLYWQYTTLNHEDNKGKNQKTLSNLINFGVHLNNLIVNDLNSDAGFSNPEINLLEKFMAGILGYNQF